MSARGDLQAIFRAGVEACLPERVLPPHLPGPPAGRTIMLALGKAAAGMAAAVEARWDGPLSGLAVAPHGTEATLRRIELVTAAHPAPDAASLAAGEQLLRLAGEAGADDLVLVLLSGGASALAALPSDGLALARKQALTAALLRSGASIGEINLVRRHLSRIKGGRLGAAAQPARLATLAISDVAGDRPEEIGSGPTVGDASTIAEAREVLERYRIADPGGWSESVKPAEAAAWRASYGMVASGRTALDAAAAEAARLGWRPVVIEAEAEGDAATAARRHAAAALAARGRTALLSGGELTVAVASRGGSGGPSRHYALALAIALDGAAGIHALAADSDGIDGHSDAAGAFVDPTTLARARAAGLHPSAALLECDSGVIFAAIQDAFVTGPIGTNVNDLRIMLVDRP